MLRRLARLASLSIEAHGLPHMERRKLGDADGISRGVRAPRLSTGSGSAAGMPIHTERVILLYINLGTCALRQSEQRMSVWNRELRLGDGVGEESEWLLDH